MSAFHRVCRAEDVKPGEGRTVVVGDKLIAIFRDGEAFRAIDDACPHMGASLSGGCVEAGIVTCPWHAWRFRLADGTWADNPRIKIGSYAVSVVEGEVHVELPDGTAARPAPRPRAD